MTRWATLAIALLVSAIATVQYTGTASGQSGDGWITLFDGKNLDHWHGDGTATFKIEDGSIIATDKKDPKAVAAYLVTKQTYKDFEIRAEFWVSDDANSGIFIRCTDPKKIGAKTCYEVNIFDQRPDPTYGTGAIVHFAEVDPMPQGRRQVEHLWRSPPRAAKFTVTFNGKKTVDGAENGLTTRKARSRCSSASAR